MMTVEAVEAYCKGCFYYRGLPKHKKQCYYRIWEEEAVCQPSVTLRNTQACAYRRVKNVRKTKRNK
jgi:hypothetical protein